ncbi:MAG: phosphoribosylanthranilate isomerase [bacterium]|nr:phosphoribosylanthranilate isomerase [bacterium]
MKNELKIKICGITNIDDALAAAGLGADYLGFVLTESRRRITPDEAGRIVAKLPASVIPVAVFRDESEEETARAAGIAGIRFIQMHGEKNPTRPSGLAGRFRLIRRIPVLPGDDAVSLGRRMEDCGDAVPLLDPGAGDGVPFDWSRFRGLPQPTSRGLPQPLSRGLPQPLSRPFWLAGGLTPDNVKRAVLTMNPAAVDVSSGVERSAGFKDYDKMKRFISEAR